MKIGEMEQCRGGCGKHVMNRSGFCKACRQSKCKKCGASFTPFLVSETVCLVCRPKLRRKDEDNFNAKVSIQE